MTSDSPLTDERIPELPSSWSDASSRVSTLEDAMAERLGARHAHTLALLGRPRSVLMSQIVAQGGESVVANHHSVAVGSLLTAPDCRLPTCDQRCCQ